MSRALPQPLRDCTARLPLSYFGIDVDLHVLPRDLADARWFFGQHERRDGAPARLAAYLHGADGFFASLLRKDTSAKTCALATDGVLGLLRRFRSWSGAPSVVPPFRSEAFARSFGVLPGAVVRPVGGTGVLIVGPNYVGKTAVTLELMGRGWEYVTDSLVVVHRRTGLVQPLRSPLGFRRATLERWAPRLEGLDTRETISPDTGRVVLARVADLFGDRLAGPVPVGTVVRLDRTAGARMVGGVDPATVFPAAAAGSVLAHLPAATSLPSGPGTTAESVADRIAALVGVPPASLRDVR